MSELADVIAKGLHEIDCAVDPGARALLRVKFVKLISDHHGEILAALRSTASAADMRERAAKVAHDFTLEANQGKNRLKVPTSWQESMTPDDVYNLGVDDASWFIRDDIRALPLDAPARQAKEIGA